MSADELVFRTFTGGPISNWDRETKALQEASGTEGWTRHDLRRTGATMLGEMGELPDIIEAALNHVSIRSPLAATYNRSRYRPQVAAALQRSGGRAGRDRGGSSEGGAAMRWCDLGLTLRRLGGLGQAPSEPSIGMRPVFGLTALDMSA